jgi:hypothetical protein
VPSSYAQVGLDSVAPAGARGTEACVRRGPVSAEASKAVGGAPGKELRRCIIPFHKKQGILKK